MYRQKQLIARTAAALVLLPLAAACGTEKADGGRGTAGAGKPAGVTGVHWSVDSVTADGRTRKAPASAHVTIDDKGRAQGSYGCNQFSARASFAGDRVTLGEASATEMACEEPAMTFEETFARILADGALKTDVGKGRLTLTTDAGDTVRLSEEKSAPLHDTKWTVTGTGADGVVQSLPQGAEGRAHLVFDERTGAVGGRLACNRVNAEATVSDGRITLGTASTTRMMCDASLMETEKRLLAFFDQTVSYRIDHRTLTLTRENGETLTAVASE